MNKKLYTIFTINAPNIGYKRSVKLGIFIPEREIL